MTTPRDISNHHNGLAVNVKDRTVYPDGGNEAQRAAAYERMAEEWRDDATEYAKELGFSDLYFVGRSGGWAMPVYGRRGADQDDKTERAAFAKFRKWCSDEMQPDALRDRFAALLADEIDNTPEAIPAPPADECARFLAYCENRRDTAAQTDKREFWGRLAGSVRKAATL